MELGRRRRCRRRLATNSATQLARGSPQPTAGLGEVADSVTPLDVGDRILPALGTQAPATPPASPRRLHPQAIPSTTEGAGAGVLATTGAGNALETGVATDQLEEIDPLFDRRRVDWHADNLTSGI